MRKNVELKANNFLFPLSVFLASFHFSPGTKVPDVTEEIFQIIWFEKFSPISDAIV